ncbi:cytidylate kinase-like family protein [Desulfocicer niacini]
MSIVTISRGSSSMGKAVAEKVAATLGYKVLSRDLLLNASDKFHVSQQSLLQALHDAPGLKDRYKNTKQIYLAYVRATLLEMVAGDNVVYHGLAGHLLLKGLDHVLKIRIIGNLENRVMRKMREDGIARHEAQSLILADDAQRKKWTRQIYGVDPADNTLYDMVICIDKLSVDDAAQFICGAANSTAFQSTEACLRKARDLSLACNVKAALVTEFPEVGITCEYGNMLLYATEKIAHNGKFKKILDSLKQDTPGIFNLEVHAGVPAPLDAV